MSYKVIKREQLSTNSIQSTEVAYFVNEEHANEFANDLDAQEPWGGNVWYEVERVGIVRPVNWMPHPPTLPDLNVTLATLAKNYDKLDKRRGIYSRYRNLATSALYIGMIFALIYVVTAQSLQASGILAVYYGEGLGITGVTLLVVSIPLYRRAGKYDLPNEQWLFLRAYDVLTDLNDFSKDPLPHFRQQAERKLSTLVNRIDDQWVSGQFTLARTMFSPLAELKTGLRERLLPAIRTGEPSKIETCLRVIAEFCNYLVSEEPNIQDVRRLNALMSPLNPVPGKKARYSIMWDWLRFHGRPGTLMPWILALGSGPILFVILTSNGFTRQDALNPSITVSLGLTGLYVTWRVAQIRLRRKPLSAP